MPITQNEIEEWILNQATGKFHYSKVLDGRIKREDLPKLRVILSRCRDKRIAMPIDGKDGWWRPVDRSLEEVYWWDKNGTIGDNLLLPLGMNDYCHIPIPSIVLIAGKYNSGKTALCINIVNYNLDKWENKIDFYVSEGAEMMGAKFKNLNEYIPKPPPFKMYRRTENFADVIEPDNLSVIDYLRVDMDKPFAVANKLFEIFNKLNKGIAVVAMQKPPGDRKLAFGGAGTAFEPALYIGMEKEWLGFEKIKVPKILTVDPYNVKIEFKLKNGVNFYDIHEVVE